MLKRPTKVLHVLGSLFPGGIERLATDISIAMKKTGEWEPSVCCFQRREGQLLTVLEKHGVHVYSCKLDRSSSSVASFPFRFAKLLRHVSPAIVHSHLDSSIPWQVLGSLLGSAKAIIFTQHNDGKLWNNHASDQWRMRLYYRLCKPFISSYTMVSLATRRNFSQMLKCSENQFEVIYNGVDTSLFRPDPSLRAQTRRAWGISESKYVIGTVGRLIKKKGVYYLLDAARELIHLDPTFHFVLVGDGRQRNRLEEIVREEGMSDSFTFAGTRMELHALYPAFDCLTSPSLSEGFGITITEAMATGIPVVATDVGGVAEVIDYGRCGVLVPSADSRALYEGILEMRRNPERAHIFVENARQRVQEHFSLQTCLARYQQVYESALNHSR